MTSNLTDKRLEGCLPDMCSSGIYGSHEEERSQGANDGVSTRPQYVWLAFVQPLLQDECVGPFPQLTGVRSALLGPLSNCRCCYFLFSCVCVLRLDVLLARKKGGSCTTQNFKKKNLNHPFTDTTLHMVASKSTPETIEGYCQIYIHSVFLSSHGRFLAFPQIFSCSKFFIPSQNSCWLCVTLYC